MTSNERDAGCAASRPLRLFIIAGEESGDRLGAPLIRALRAAHPAGVEVAGVGGEGMIAEGLTPLFPLHEIAVMGMDEIVRRLPTLIRLIRQASEAVVAARPDALVIIDSPDFTHRVARRVRKMSPGIPIVDYVSPTVWAWRPGRARAMARYIDTLLAILPFEPEVHERLGGPPTVYVGHPLFDHMPVMAPGQAARALAEGERPVLLILPGSRRTEIDSLLTPFGAALERVDRMVPGGVEALLPAVAHHADEIERRVADWPVRPSIVRGEEEKRAAFARARAAIAASGTVTLELALAGVPMVVAYRLDRFYRLVKQINHVIPIVRAPSMVLPNIIIGQNVIPELLDAEVVPDALAAHAYALIQGGEARERQLAALCRVQEQMVLPNGRTASERAADEIVRVAARSLAAAPTAG